MDKKGEQGSLYICGTPIGNLEDITLRCLRVLNQVALIAAEDTRHTQKLLNHYQIKTKTTSYHQHNEKEKTSYLLQMIQGGLSLALVSSAGMPLISDPGQHLIQEALAHNIHPIPIPGPTALTAALVVSGLSTTSFLFAGFLPQKTKERKALLLSLSQQEQTIIFYEAPHRLMATLQEIHELMGERRLVLVREITKIHEERLEGTAQELLIQFKERSPRGEITLLLAGCPPQKEPVITEDDMPLQQHLSLYLQRGMTKKEAVKQISKERDLPKGQVYKEAIRFTVDPATGKVQYLAEDD